MKFLFDLFPVILFFLTFKVAQSQNELAHDILSRLLGGGIDPDQAPVLCATVIAIAATFAQVGWLKLRGKKVELMLWLSLIIISVFGGLTLWLHNPWFIKWKPSILYWVFAAILIFGSLTGRNFIRRLLSGQIELPDHSWDTLQRIWIGFFLVVGVLNLAVAYTCSTETWVNFKLFGLMGITIAFTIAMGFYIARFSPELKEPEKKDQN